LTQITNTTVGNNFSPAINATGSRIAFVSNSDLVGGNADGNSEIFLWDASTGFSQITNTTSGISETPAINAAGNRIAFHSDADLVGTNGDRNNEIFLASCVVAAAEIPAVSPLGLGALTLLLGLAAAWTFRKGQRIRHVGE
jgi:Tol biopolymer transport system component